MASNWFWGPFTISVTRILDTNELSVRPALDNAMDRFCPSAKKICKWLDDKISRFALATKNRMKRKTDGKSNEMFRSLWKFHADTARFCEFMRNASLKKVSSACCALNLVAEEDKYVDFANTYSGARKIEGKSPCSHKRKMRMREEKAKLSSKSWKSFPFTLRTM